MDIRLPVVHDPGDGSMLDWGDIQLIIGGQRLSPLLKSLLHRDMAAA